MKSLHTIVIGAIVALLLLLLLLCAINVEFSAESLDVVKFDDVSPEDVIVVEVVISAEFVTCAMAPATRPIATSQTLIFELKSRRLPE
jgi:hypothetical protein